MKISWLALSLIMFFVRWYLFVKISFEFGEHFGEFGEQKRELQEWTGISLMSEHLANILHHHHHRRPCHWALNTKNMFICVFLSISINQCQIEHKIYLCVVPWVHGKCFLSTENKRHTKQSKWAHARIQQNQTKTHILKATVIIQNTHIQTKHTQCVLRI